MHDRMTKRPPRRSIYVLDATNLPTIPSRATLSVPTTVPVVVIPTIVAIVVPTIAVTIASVTCKSSKNI